MRCTMSITKRPMADVVSNFSCIELNCLLQRFRSSIMRAKFLELRWILSIFMTKRTSQSSLRAIMSL